jgi:hypothetical protein
MSNGYITNFSRDDGFGAQYQTILFSIIYSELVNKEFVYNPFTKMEHNYDKDPNFLKEKENLINIIGNYKSINDVDTYEITTPEIYRIVEGNINKCVELESFKKAKRLFLQNKSIKIKENDVDVAVHIRRCNPHDNGQSYGYTDDEYYLNVIKHIRHQHSKNKTFHIYSQGDLKSFEKFKADDVVFHLNEKLENTMYDLVTSDILVMSKSSLSYVSGLLSDGVVYYLPFWHNKLNKWKTI